MPAESTLAPANFLDLIPRVEDRPDMIPKPRNPTWEMFLTGAEGYCGRNLIESGGIYTEKGQPLIQTIDYSFDTHDLIHHQELKAIHDMFEAKKIPEKVQFAGTELTVEEGCDPELYFQAMDEKNNCAWTIIHTHRHILVGSSKNPDINLREMKAGMMRVADFFLICTF